MDEVVRFEHTRERPREDSRGRSRKSSMLAKALHAGSM
jgi:hypothetical protein